VNSTSSGVIERLSRPAAALLPIVAALLFWHVIPRSARGNENTDYRLFYRPVAGALVAGEGWEVPPGFALAAYPPGYPLLLAAVLAPASRLHVGEQTALDVFALACLAGSSLLVFTLARRLAGPRVALCASAALSTYPPLLWLSKQPNSELPFLVFLIGSVLATADLALAHRRGVVWPLLAGALAGGAMLIRPIGLVLPPALAVSLAVHPAPRRQRVTRIALLLLGSAVAVLPWELWVATRTGVVVPLSSSGPASVVDGLTFGVRSKGYRQAVAPRSRRSRAPSCGSVAVVRSPAPTSSRSKRHGAGTAPTAGGMRSS
jgi:4-amino-4-deoxy-L-arabinose transferase-like glycosyltransferase